MVAVDLDEDGGEAGARAPTPPPLRYQFLDPAAWQPPQVLVVGFQLLTVTSTVPVWWVAVFTVCAVKL